MRAVPYSLAGVSGAMTAAGLASSGVPGLDELEDWALDDRMDMFCGMGAEAGRASGKIKEGGRLVVPVPIERAYAMLSDL